MADDQTMRTVDNSGNAVGSSDPFQISVEEREWLEMKFKALYEKLKYRHLGDWTDPDDETNDYFRLRKLVLGY